MGPYKQEFSNSPHIVGVWNRRSPTFGRDLADKVKRKKEKCTIHIGKARESKRRTLPCHHRLSDDGSTARVYGGILIFQIRWRIQDGFGPTHESLKFLGERI